MTIQTAKTSPPPNRVGRKTIRLCLPIEIIERLSQSAERKGTTLSSEVAAKLAR